MQNLKIIKTPKYTTMARLQNSLKFDCYDKNLHLRLKDYRWNNIITGTINKVSFLLSYYFSYIRLSAKDRVLDFSSDTMIDYLKNQLLLYESNKDNFDLLKDQLMLTEVGDIKLVTDSVISHFHTEDLIILPVYRKIETKGSTCFGDNETLNVFRNIIVDWDDIENQDCKVEMRWNIISDLLNYLGLTLDEFLYDDSIELILDHEDRNDLAYRKYFNKKSQQKQKKNK